jgi:hypothetical protein
MSCYRFYGLKCDDPASWLFLAFLKGQGAMVTRACALAMVVDEVF